MAKIDTLTEENVKYKNDLNQQKEISQSLSDELSASISNVEQRNKEFEKTLNEKNICEGNFAQLEKVVDDLNKKIHELSSNLNTSEECNKKYLTKIDTLEEQNVKYKYELDQLENEKETRLLELSSENKERDKLLNENKILEEDYINLITTIAMYNEELNKVVQSLKTQQSVSEIRDFPNSYYPLNLSSELNSPEKSMKGDKLDELNRLGEQISKINSYIHLYSEKETFYQKEIDNLKAELATSSTNYFDLAENLKEQNSDNESLITSLTENLHNIIEKYNHLQVEHCEQLNRIKEYEVEITKLKKIHSDITLTNELKITNLEDEILKFEEEILSTKKIHDNMVETRENKIKVLEDNLAGSTENVNYLKAELEKVTDEYNVKVSALEMKITLLEEEKVNILKTLQHLKIENASEIDNLQINILSKEKLITSLKEQCEDNEAKISTMQVQMAMVKEELTHVKNRSGKTEEEYQSSLANLQVQIVASKLEITKLSSKIDVLMLEKDEYNKQLKAMDEERNKEIQARTTLSYELEKERELNEQLRNEVSEKNVLLSEVGQYTELQGKYEKLQQETLNQKFLEKKQIELQQKIETLMKSNEVQKETYEVFKIYFKEFRDKFDKLISQKNILERITNNLRVLVVSMNKNMPVESVHLKTLFEKKEAMEVIAEDIMKQYNRCSKQMNDIVFDILSYYEKTCDDLLSTLDIQIQNYSEKYNLEELDIQISDLTERTADALEQVKVLQKDLENLGKVENVKVQKENILGTSRQINVDKMKEDEMKKKNLMLRQKVTLLENAKSNLEKTVKKLRDENKKIKEGCDKTAPTNDAHYNMLLQEYVDFKDKHNDILKEYKTKLEQLHKEYEEHKNGCMRTSTPLGDEPDLPSEAEKYLMADLNNLREAYSSIRAIKAKLETENLYSKKLIEEQKEEISKFNFMKEAYDKLLEENSKLMTDVDTMKYKRTRDRDEFLRLLRKERSENDLRNSKQLQEIRNDYEGKLEKMKEKMIKLYREEVNKEMSKVKAGQHESTTLLKIIEQLKGDLFEAEQKVQVIEAERDMLRKSRDQTNLRGSRESFSSLQLHDSDTRSLRDFPASSAVSSSRPFSSSSRPSIEFKHPSAMDARRQSEVRRVSTLPRTGTVVEEVTLTRRTSFGVTDSIGPNLHMEDEEEMFNNKYLADLKQGKCDLPASDDRDSRVSELAWRNSLVPPHLKSSYPAEMQFCSPGRFKDDDIKTGNIPFDDSLSKLLPGEKPRKKDFGTTSYKKPGPPTPSKNGGRLSLQGNEVHPAREPPAEPKKSTPGRIRALFTGKNSSRSSTEVSPPKRRLNIFRR
ncbi:hypothetical protein WA026_011696 [Henosepilachna vigintioctopunctata]|uniref:Uncharacterized protein n=1 Tax=Henosepilachna vigintioctopunctata TaxID=420089 RepID=A0AAW1UD36_9CUCU